MLSVILGRDAPVAREKSRAYGRGTRVGLSAKGRIYRYKIWTPPVLSPLEYRRAWHVAGSLRNGGGLVAAPGSGVLGRREIHLFEALVSLPLWSPRRMRTGP